MKIFTVIKDTVGYLLIKTLEAGFRLRILIKRIDNLIVAPKHIKIPFYFLSAIAIMLTVTLLLQKAYALTYSNGMAATVVVGQQDFSYSSDNHSYPTASSLNAPEGIATGSGHLFVADTYNNRVLIYNSIPTNLSATADVVIGQADFSHNNGNQGQNVAANTLAQPASVCYANGKLVVGDWANNRILVFNSVPTSNNTSADVVIGQPDMNTRTDNSANPQANTIAGFTNVFCDPYSGKLIVADMFNNRVLIFNSIPTSNNASANVVLGQPDFTTNTDPGATVNAHTLRQPETAIVARGNLVIGDGANRVVIFTGIPSSNNADASFVIGAANLTTQGSGSVSQSTVLATYNLLWDGSRLLVNDGIYNRILVFNSLPSSNGVAANSVIGQPDFTTSSSGTSSTKFNGPHQMAVANGTLFVADSFNHRIMAFGNYTSSGTATFQFNQPNFTSKITNYSGDTIPNSQGYSYNWGLATDGTHMFVSDCNNNRVLIYNSVPTGNDAAADVVIGQPDMNSGEVNQGGSADDNTLNCPEYLATDGTRLFIVDEGNNRVLIYNTIPTSNNASANVVIGQPDMTSTNENQGGSPAANTLGFPQGVYYDSGTGKLLITDSDNNRVLIYNTVPSSNNASANVVVGQPDMNSGSTDQGGSAAANTLDFPQNARILQNKLVIADSENNRVLIYNTIPTSNNASANVVVGQVLMTDESSNQGGSVSANGLNWPTDILWDGSHFLIQDDENNRVLVYSSIPSSNNAAASFVLGQPDMTSSDAGTSDTTLNDPEGQMDFANDRLLVGDSSNNRIVIFGSVTNPTPSPAPTPGPSGFGYANGMDASFVIGEDDLYQNAIDAENPTATGLMNPADVETDGTRLIVSDQTNNRVVIFNSIPTATHSAANIVVGQTTLTHNAYNATASAMDTPQTVSTDGTHLFVADKGNSRVLIWNSMPTSNNTPADVVIGQPDMTSHGINQGSSSSNDFGTVAANTLYKPDGVFYSTSSGKLFITDTGNNRVLIFNSIPSSNNASADVVVGQANMASKTANQGGSVAANTLSGPSNTRVIQNELVITDTTNNRVLIYNSIPSSNNASADIAVGQADLTHGSANRGGSVAANSLSAPDDVFFDGANFLVSDSNNNRVLIFSSIPASSSASATKVIGQSDLISSSAGTTATTLNKPRGILVTGGVLFVADSNEINSGTNNRVMAYNDYLNSTTGSFVLGQNSMTTSYVNDVPCNDPEFPDCPNTKGLDTPSGVATDGTHLFISEGGGFSQRIRIYNTIPTASGALADVEIGQPDFSTTLGNNQGATPAAHTLYYPGFLTSDGTHLIASDEDNNRVLIYNPIPTTNNASANVVLGQSNMTSSTANRGGSLAANTLNLPNGVDYDNQTGKLLVSDSGNNRVLIFNSIPTTNGASANVVVGQSDMTHSASGGIYNFGEPWNARIIEGKLMVVDRVKNRILIYNSVPTTNGAIPDVVIGQSDFTSSFANQGGAAAANTLSNPTDILWDGSHLVIQDSSNNRILIFNSIPTTNNASADFVLGQPDFSSTTYANNGTPNGLSDPEGQMAFFNNTLFIGDYDGMRVVAFAATAPVPTSTPTSTPTPTSAPGSSPTPTAEPPGSSPPVCSDSKPGNPSNLLATAGPGSGQVTLTWRAATDPVSYYSITYSDDPDVAKWGVVNVGKVTTYVISGLTPGVKYYFWVNAVNGCMPGDRVGPVYPGGGSSSNISTPSGSFTPNLNTPTSSESGQLPPAGPAEVMKVGILGIGMLLFGALMLLAL